MNRGRAKLSALMGGQLEVASEGNRVVDDRGESYLDCGGSGVFLLGHRPPAVVRAVAEQLERHPVATRMLLDPTQAEAAEALARVAPEGLDYVHWATSGADAVEVALKIARLNGRRTIVAAEGGFHGKSLGALSATGNRAYREPFEPLLPDVEHVPFGDAAAIEATLARSAGRACVILEPIQSIAGVVIPPEGYLSRVEALCREHDAMLVLDEVQTGLGRVGEWWGADREGVVPDVLLAGKVLTGGVVPSAAVVSTAEAYEPLSRDPLLHNSTFGGAPIAMAAARATIETLEEGDYVARARDLGARLLDSLRDALEPDGEVLLDVRGAGLLIGIEFSASHVAGDFTLEMLSRKVLVNATVYSRPVISITPPATLDDAEEEWLVGAAAECVAALRERYARTVPAEAG
ncbi:MAG TPA: aminotransferase class III-fold pyridoxal phosphate-dependent enzyme [Thermoleophilaceae bacterium]